MEQQSAPVVIPFRLPPLVRKLVPDDLDQRLSEVINHNCLLSIFNSADRTLVMFRFKDSCIQNWFAQAPLTRDEALAIVQDESIRECLPQHQNYFFEYTPPTPQRGADSPD